MNVGKSLGGVKGLRIEERNENEAIQRDCIIEPFVAYTSEGDVRPAQLYCCFQRKALSFRLQFSLRPMLRLGAADARHLTFQLGAEGILFPNLIIDGCSFSNIDGRRRYQGCGKLFGFWRGMI